MWYLSHLKHLKGGEEKRKAACGSATMEIPGEIKAGNATVAQLDRALASEAEGCWFDPSQSHQSVLEERARIVSAMRSFFDAEGFIEVETPVRICAPAPEPHIDCPEVMSRGGPRTFLRASPELQMKKLLAAGMERIYQIGPCFRDGEKGSRHNPEFTMLEWYRCGSDYTGMMSDMERLVKSLPHGDRMGGPFARISVREGYRLWAGWDPWTGWDRDRFDFDMAEKIEPALKNEGGVFLVDYPPQAASLARVRDGVAERWEFYFRGLELANCFSELCDPDEQARRFEAAAKERAALGEADYPVDGEFLSSLGGIESAAGVALGVDRIVMALLGASSIDEVRAAE